MDAAAGGVLLLRVSAVLSAGEHAWLLLEQFRPMSSESESVIFKLGCLHPGALSRCLNGSINNRVVYFYQTIMTPHA